MQCAYCRLRVGDRVAWRGVAWRGEAWRGDAWRGDATRGAAASAPRTQRSRGSATDDPRLAQKAHELVIDCIFTSDQRVAWRNMLPSDITFGEGVVRTDYASLLWDAAHKGARSGHNNPSPETTRKGTARNKPHSYNNNLCTCPYRTRRWLMMVHVACQDQLTNHGQQRTSKLFADRK